MSERRAHTPRVGVPPENSRQLLVKLCWMLVWMVYLAYPISDLFGRHNVPKTVFGWIMLAVFLGCYVSLIIRRQVSGTANTWDRRQGVALAAMYLASIATSVVLDANWLALFTYTAVATGIVLPQRIASVGVVVVVATQVGLGLASDIDHTGLAGMALGGLLGGFAMTGLQQLVRTMAELREARQAVAALAASDERLRLARDLHDLLGHSLSLITLKTELTARFMDQERYEEARSQVDDIEKVSRQALVDVREAIGGYRRPKLAVELAAARTALSAADIAIDAPLSLADPRPGLGAEEEGALGWALREGITNVVRHSGATQCRIRLIEDHAPDGRLGRVLTLEIADNGTGGGKQARHGVPGNGLTGLSERLALADGSLDAGPDSGKHGFVLRATVPLRAVQTPVQQPAAGTVQE
ncbi:sensor histidine kinase [Streptacidiphilus jiangxiensis]|uniref:Two-component system, NarL family, sensor histidine kinase DesK n=1 Tax=Streptacidiphilus jiangxiensis TaxID=235985 RepID=A0A1H7FVD1_STRJI|nr:histidine kinase [Streptacidiphilus jiangxiensis]SEK28452.1 two-component system, NarL family, sensor histidine kinase DesK [Streptacidiphilus jiangxiensis]